MQVRSRRGEEGDVETLPMSHDAEITCISRLPEGWWRERPPSASQRLHDEQAARSALLLESASLAPPQKATNS